MGTVVFNPSPSFFSTSFQFRRQPKLGAPIFFVKGNADRSRVPRLKVSCRILDGNTGHRRPKKISPRNQPPQVKESDIHALVKQVQSSLRKETPDKKTLTQIPNKRKSEPSPSAKKSAAAAFWENHLLARKQVSAEKGNGALTELLLTRKPKFPNYASKLDSLLATPKKREPVGDTKSAQVKKSEPVVDLKSTQPVVDLKPTQPVVDLKPTQPVVDLKSTRPRSKFLKRSPIPRPMVKEEEIEEEELVSESVIADKTEEPELATLDKMKVSELRQLAKSRGIKVYYKLKKKELLEILESQE